MRSHVFTDRELAKHAGRFVWLSINTEQEKNAGFLERYPVSVWPTLFVLDPEAERAALQWVGSANVGQLIQLLADGERAVRGASEGPEAALARADRLLAEGKGDQAIAAFREALALAPPTWERRPRTIESLVLTHATTGDDAGCARAAAELLPTLPDGPSFANAAGVGLSCALSAPRTEPDRARWLTELEAAVTKAVSLPGLLADDRSGLYETLVSARDDRGDEAGGQKLALEWLSFLEAQAAAAGTAEARAAFDAHRLSAALRAKVPERVLGALEASERDLPTDYNPPARLALALRELGRLDEALEAVERALGKVYGPRKLRVLETKADLFARKKDFAAAKATYREALAALDELPAPQQSKKVRARLEAALSKLP